jgi:hypothetical protein
VHRDGITSILCACENLSLKLREKYTLTVFENRVQRKIFGLKREEVTGDCTVHSFIIKVTK